MITISESAIWKLKRINRHHVSVYEIKALIKANNQNYVDTTVLLYQLDSVALSRKENIDKFQSEFDYLKKEIDDIKKANSIDISTPKSIDTND